MRLYTGSGSVTNDVDYLENKGYSGQINDTMFTFLGWLGLEGALNDKLRYWATELKPYAPYIKDGVASGGSVIPTLIYDPANGIIAERDLQSFDYVEETILPILIYDPQNGIVGDR